MKVGIFNLKCCLDGQRHSTFQIRTSEFRPACHFRHVGLHFGLAFSTPTIWLSILSLLNFRIFVPYVSVFSGPLFLVDNFQTE